MDKYKFKLEKLLNIRKEKEEEAKKEFMKVQREMKIIQDTLDELNEKLKKHSQGKPTESVIERKIRNNYINSVNIEIRNTEDALEKKKEEVEAKRKETVARQVDRKTVEKLKEKGQEAFDKEIENIEQKSNDEFALFGYIRNRERR